MEQLMQFVWEHRLGLLYGMTTTDGHSIRVVDQGVLNRDAGPDFFNATVEIGNDTWVGNVELHVRASDWFRHGHQNDRAYDSVILHVVMIDDTPVRRPGGEVIPQVVIRCSAQAAARCNALVSDAARMLPCRNTIASLPGLFHTEWLTALAMERLYRKSDSILSYVKANGGYWEGAAYVTMARGLGFGLNSEPFEVLAKNVPLGMLYKHRDEPLTIEAILFGQAGLIPAPEKEEDSYIPCVRREYEFMCRKFSLHRPPISWKLSKTRPQNFPHRRLAALCQMVADGFQLMGKLDDARTPDDLRRLFEIELEGFWANHYSYHGKAASMSAKALSKQSIETLIINVAIPLLHARCFHRGDYDGMQRCVELMQQLKPEDNTFVRMFAEAGIKATDAFITQAIVQLRREYCEKRKCIYCRFGHRMLSAEIQR